MERIVLTLALVGSALAAALPSALAQGEPPTVTVASPVVREVVEDSEFIGRFSAIDDVAMRARVSGYLDEVHFRDGQLVEAGTLLFTIDQRPFQAALSEAQAQVRNTEARLEFAQTQFERAQELEGRGTVATAILDERRREQLTAQAEADAAEALLRRARLNLEFTEVRAPISGRIDRNLVSVGNLVLADQTVLTSIVSLNPIEFYFDIDERAMLAFQRDARARGGALQEGAGGLPVRVRLADERDGPFQGELDFAENRVDDASGTTRLRARFDNPDLIMQPGMFGRINVPASLPYEGILVPDQAVASDQNRRVVYSVDDAGNVTAIPVRPGPRIYGYRVIRSGLTGEETIVVNGLSRIRPGVTVTPERVELPPEADGAEG
ncbi:MAG: efflux RND transporter periplasmic adaptor subunit [Pseudomonadota bacterium]